MDKETMFVTGSTGLVGSYFCSVIDLSKYCFFASVHSGPLLFANSLPIDLSTSPGKLGNLIDKLKPNIIVNLAAMTNVDQCEVEKETADNINHLAVKEIAKYIQKNMECYLLHVSTDYVFDGAKGNYEESDNPNPINWYGTTKLLAEQELISCDSKNWCIARTSTPFGIHQKKISFPLYVITNLRQKKEISVLTDQITSPTYARDLVEMLFEIVRNRIKGVLHVCGSSQISRFDQALEIVHAMNLDHNLIKPIGIDEMKWKAARRPKNSSLSVNKVCNALRNTKPIDFPHALTRFSKELN